MIEMKKSLPREAHKNALLPSFMQENNNSRMNLITLNSKGLRENNFSQRDFYSPKSGFKTKDDFSKEAIAKKNWMRHTVGSRFTKTKKENKFRKKYDSDDEDSLSELFHEHNL